MAIQADPVGFRRFSGLGDRGIERVRGIYEEAFPVRQRESFEKLAAEHTGDSTDLAFVAVQGETPVGFSFLSRLASVSHLFLTYFAVDASCRDHGVGAALWAATREALRSQGETEPVVLEVEAPDAQGVDDPERRQRQRRVDFWHRVGAVTIVEDGYNAPFLDGTGAEPMHVMRFGDIPLERPDEVLNLVLALYLEGYGLDVQHALVGQARDRWG